MTARSWTPSRRASRPGARGSNVDKPYPVLLECVRTYRAGAALPPAAFAASPGALAADWTRSAGRQVRTAQARKYGSSVHGGPGHANRRPGSTGLNDRWCDSRLGDDGGRREGAGCRAPVVSAAIRRRIAVLPYWPFRSRNLRLRFGIREIEAAQSDLGPGPHLAAGPCVSILARALDQLSRPCELYCFRPRPGVCVDSRSSNAGRAADDVTRS